MRCSRLLIHIWWQSTDTKLLPDVSFPFILHVLWGLWFLYVPTYDGRYMQTYQTWTTPPKDMPIWSLLGPRCSTTMALRWWVPTASGQEIWLWSLGAWGWQLGWCLYMFSREWPWIRSLFGNKFCTFCWPTPHFAYLKSNEIDLFWAQIDEIWLTHVMRNLQLFATKLVIFRGASMPGYPGGSVVGFAPDQQGGRSSALAPCPVTRRRLGRLGGGRDSPGDVCW